MLCDAASSGWPFERLRHCLAQLASQVVYHGGAQQAELKESRAQLQQAQQWLRSKQRVLSEASAAATAAAARRATEAQAKEPEAPAVPIGTAVPPPAAPAAAVRLRAKEM